MQQEIWIMQEKYERNILQYYIMYSEQPTENDQEIYDNAVEKGGSVYITKPLSGEINLRGNKNISELHFANGHIERIYNVPRTLKKLIINNNHLIDVPSLEFSNLVHLEVKNNNISRLDLKHLPNLTNLNVANNKCTTIENIPESLKYLNADNNNLTSLNLNNVFLTYVSCVGNPLLKKIVGTKNVGSIHKDANIQIVGGTKITGGVNVDLQEAVNEYYRLKSEYSKELKEYKVSTNKVFGSDRSESISSFVKCVNCKKTGGTKFWKDDRGHLRAICGNSSEPCNLNIDILANLNDSDFQIQRIQNEIDEIKQNIVKLKMDSIFGYISEKDSAENFEILKKKLMDNNNAMLLNDNKYSYYEIVNDSDKQRIINLKMQNIHQELGEIRTLLNNYKKTHKDKIMKDIGLKHKHINDQMELVRGLKYPVNEVIHNNNLHILKQYPYSFDELYNKHSDLLKVEKMDK